MNEDKSVRTKCSDEKGASGELYGTMLRCPSATVNKHWNEDSDK